MVGLRPLEASILVRIQVRQQKLSMTYCRARNKTINEYSGHQEISLGLRSRLNSVCNHYIAHGYIASERTWIPAIQLNHEIKLRLDKETLTGALSGTYDEAFEAVEIFLSAAKAYASSRYSKILADVISVFDIAGSVYRVDENSGRIELRIDGKLAEDIDIATAALSSAENAESEFKNAVGGLMSRSESPEDTISAIFIAFEDYLKNKTGMKEYGGSVDKLMKDEVISPTQKSLLDKIYAYRSDTYGIGHAGKAKKPEEVDALWFLETVTAQILFLDRKLKSHNLTNN